LKPQAHLPCSASSMNHPKAVKPIL
jgi:hypothetical protein